MAINSNYIRPQSEVHQLLNVATNQASQHGYACIIGAQYDLYRYGKEDLKGYTFGTETTGIELEYDKDASGLINYTVDEQSIQLYGEDILANVATLTEDVTVANGTYTVLQAPEGKFWAADYASQASDNLVCADYSVSIGDIILTQDGLQAKVVSLIKSEADPSAFDKIKVSKCLFDLTQPVTSLSGVSVCKSFSGTLELPVEYSEGKVTVSSLDQAIIIKGKNNKSIECKLQSGTGKVYVEFRVLVSYARNNNNGIIAINTIEDIQNQLGNIDVNNELAYACYCAISGSAGKTVYAIRVDDVTPEAFLYAVKKTESNNAIYSFVPVTSDVACMEKVIEFNDSLSTAVAKKWRINFIGVDVTNASPTTVDNKGMKLKGTFYSTVSGTATTHLFELSEDTISNGFDFEQYSVGDYIQMQDAEIKDKYIIKQVFANNLVALNVGPTSTNQEVSVQVTRSNSVVSNINYAKSVASKFNSRRTVAVWCDGGKKSGVHVNNVFISAEIAGLASSALPHQGLTNTEIKSIDNANRIHTMYSQGQLDQIASAGVLVIAQDTETSSPYIRHQLTTSPDKGILYSELSCTRNIDSISYGVADIVSYYVGRANVVDQAIDRITLDLTSYWNSLATVYTDSLLGPSLVSYDNYSIVQDPQAMDRLIINVDYHIPSPMNGIAVYQMVYVATVTL